MEDKKWQMEHVIMSAPPHIGADGFWYVGGVCTDVRAVGMDGITPNIGADGYWYIWDKNMGVKAVGEQGIKGEKGNQGDQGTTGATGPQGPAGAQGSTGSQGPTGATGPQGATGPKGDTGVAGPQGTQGLQGIKGESGVQGPKGENGDRGEKGDQGLQGLQGIRGEIGNTGERGPTGPVNIANNLTTEKEGYALDARQGTEIKNTFDKLASAVEVKVLPLFDFLPVWSAADFRCCKIGKIVYVSFSIFAGVVVEDHQYSVLASALPEDIRPSGVTILTGSCMNEAGKNTGTSTFTFHPDGKVTVLSQKAVGWQKVSGILITK